MAKSKNIITFFSEAVGLYFSNFRQFVQYMSFPVLGQVLGLLLIFSITYIYTQNIPKLIDKFPNLDNPNSLILISLFVLLPGLAIFIKAFWEYIVAYGAINSMYENMSKSGRVYDFTAHTELVKRRIPAFAAIWLLLGVFSILAILPPFWIICGILAIYFVLVFQVFTFEPELSPINCFKRSFSLIKGRFAKTFLLIFLVGGLTYLIIPQIFVKLVALLGIDNFISNSIYPILVLLSQINFEEYGLPKLQPHDLSLFVVQSVIAQIIVLYTLPLRSIFWSLWYRECSKNSEKMSASVKKKIKKRPSEKLMEASKKKYSSKKKIDTNLLRRAMEENEE